MKAFEPTADPFKERRRPRGYELAQVLGGRFRFESDSRELLRLVRAAYAGLPSHVFSRPAPRFVVRLELGCARSRRLSPFEPAPVQALAGGGLLCGAMEGSACVTVSPEQRSALIVIPPQLLRFPYHLRYELVEFAVYCLATRAQQLVPLHGACLGSKGRGVLLLGRSGAGKSTLMLQSLAEGGLEFLAEDSVLVQPRSLLATGVANFLHVRADSLRFVAGTPLARHIRRSPVIRRRSGVRKYELDLRQGDLALAPAPLRLSALVFLTPEPTRAHASLLSPLPVRTLATRLRAEQPYAAHQPGWRPFLSRIARLPVFELRRGGHPREAVAALAQLLDGRGSRAHLEAG
jgi:hypothetical protein